MTTKAISISTYLVVFVALLLLLGLTLLIAEIDLGRFMLLATLAIATLKAALVVIYFMHLRMSDPFTKFVAVAALLWLSLLIGLTMGDVVYRNPELPSEVGQVDSAH